MGLDAPSCELPWRRQLSTPQGTPDNAWGTFPGSQLGALPASSAVARGADKHPFRSAQNSPLKQRTVWPQRSLRPDAVVGKLPHRSPITQAPPENKQSRSERDSCRPRVLTRASKSLDGNKEVQRPPHRQGGGRW